MSGKIRWVIPHQVYESTIRTVDRNFLFKPNHHPDNPLLAESCPPEALDMNNDIIPSPSIINIIGAAIGRALEKHPIQIHCFEANMTHLHEEFSATDEQVDNVAAFFRDVHSLIARGINKTWDREGHVFGARPRIHPCLDEASAEKHLLYAVTNAVKDNLLESVSKSPLFSTYSHQAKGEKLRFWYIDYEAYWAVGGDRKKTHRLKDYLKWVEWHCTPLPGQAAMTERQRQTWMRRQVREIETDARQTRKDAGKSVLGKDALFAVDPRGRPKDPKISGQEPLCHAADPERAKEYKKSWQFFMDQFIAASIDYRNGDFNREFPAGSYRPPLVSIYSASKL